VFNLHSLQDGRRRRFGPLARYEEGIGILYRTTLEILLPLLMSSNAILKLFSLCTLLTRCSTALPLRYISWLLIDWKVWQTLEVSFHTPRDQASNKLSSSTIGDESAAQRGEKHDLVQETDAATLSFPRPGNIPEWILEVLRHCCRRESVVRATTTTC